MSTIQQVGLVGNSVKVQRLPAASAATYQGGNRFYTLVGSQEGYITGHTYHTILSGDSYLWEDATSQGMLTVSSESEMTALLANENTRKYVKYVGESGTYIKDQIYELAPTTDNVSFYELPILENEGTSDDIIDGKQFINSKGEKVVGKAVAGAGKLAMDLFAKTIVDINDSDGNIIQWPFVQTSFTSTFRAAFATGCSSLSRVVLPNIQSTSSYGGYSNMLPSNMFNGCTLLRTVNIGGNPSWIGSSAYKLCKNLRNIGNVSYITQIEGSAFMGCKFVQDDEFVKPCFSALKTIGDRQNEIFHYASLFDIDDGVFPQLTMLAGNSTFAETNNITKVSLTALQRIDGWRVFYGCKDLSEVVLPNLLYLLGSDTFTACSNLISVSLPNCQLVASSVFTYCTKLQKMVLPKCQRISQKAFEGCSSLSMALLPVCSSIASYTFSGCRQLMSVYLFSNSIVSIGINVFTNTPITSSNLTLPYAWGSVYVPASLLTEYQSAAIWSGISGRLVGLEDEQISAILTANNIEVTE